MTDRTTRIAIFTIGVVLLLIIFYLWQGTPIPNTSDGIIMFSSLIMLSLITLFLEKWFTKPTDVLASSISILLLLAPLNGQLERFGSWYDILLGYSFLMALMAMGALLLLDGDKPETAIQNRLSTLLRDVSTSIGNGRVLYFGLFILTLLFFVDSQSKYFLILFGYSAIIILMKPEWLIFKLLNRRTGHTNDIGEIFGVQSKNTFLVKLYKNRDSIRRFDIVEFGYSMDESDGGRTGLIIDKYFLNQEQWIRVLTLPVNSIASVNRQSIAKNNVVFKIESDAAAKKFSRLVGVVIENSNILRIQFEYLSKSPVTEGSLVEVLVGDVRVLYQVVEGTTSVELLERKNEAGLIVGEAVQLGTWNEVSLSFEKFGWVPEVNSPVNLAAEIPPVDVPDEDLLLGNIPGTNFPILLNSAAAVSHHMAILGVTGVGKSVFTRDLIRKISRSGTKFICVDFTGEYEGKFRDLDCSPIVDDRGSQQIFGAIEVILQEMVKFPNLRDHNVISGSEGVLRREFATAIEGFLTSDKKISTFELPDVSNSTSILEYTKWFFKVLFEIAKREGNYGERVCVVLEEAHTVIPEWNFIGTDDRSAQSVVNSISQIALQGRKYGVGFIVIAQRTANVSKTVLTQCNTVIAFQQFDRTSGDFLSNYMGSDMIEALPKLRPRQAIAVGKGLRSGMPIIFQVPEISEPEEAIAPTVPRPPPPPIS